MTKTNLNLTFMKQMIDIHKWVIEATSNHNDGWIRQHYIDKLKKLKDELNSLEFLNEYENGEKSK